MNRHSLLINISIMIIVFVIIVTFFLKLEEIKAGIRNDLRKGNIADIKKALYFHKESIGNYPIAKEGGCIGESGRIKNELEELKIIKEISADPLWPDTPPSSLNSDSLPEEGTDGFCYWYVSEDGRGYHLSYYMEECEDSKQEIIIKSAIK